LTLRGITAGVVAPWPTFATGLSFAVRAIRSRFGSGGSVVRYVIEFLIPAMVVIVAALVLFRNRSDQPARASANRTNDDSGTLSTGTFIVILIIGAALTVALVYALHTGSS
jgi:hypothetical protein